MKERPLARLGIVIPCYNEEAVLPVTTPQFLQQIAQMVQLGLVSADSRIVFVDDGSKDKTWSLICELSKQHPEIIGIKQSRNRGHQNAVLAGLMWAKDEFDVTISIDCDGQDDVSAMTQMMESYYQGNDVVYGVRSSRKTDTFFKRFSAESFYRLINTMGAEVVFNHADYRLISKSALAGLAQFQEVNLFLRGLVPLVGFQSSTVEYQRHERLAGESHYPISKMLGLAWDGITSLSIRPIRLISFFGALVSFLSFIMLIWSFVSFFLGWTVPGWASLTVMISFMGGIQLLSIGIIGEYVGKIYLESKRRPRYILEKVVANGEFSQEETGE